MLVRRNRQTNHAPKIVGLENWPGDGMEISQDNSLKIKKMRYLITTIEESPFMTEWFIPENNFSQGMIVYDLYKNKYMTDGKTWIDIEYDHF